MHIRIHRRHDRATLVVGSVLVLVGLLLAGLGPTVVVGLLEDLGWS